MPNPSPVVVQPVATGQPQQSPQPVQSKKGLYTFLAYSALVLGLLADGAGGWREHRFRGSHAPTYSRLRAFLEQLASPPPPHATQAAAAAPHQAATQSATDREL